MEIQWRVVVSVSGLGSRVMEAESEQEARLLYANIAAFVPHWQGELTASIQRRVISPWAEVETKELVRRGPQG